MSNIEHHKTYFLAAPERKWLGRKCWSVTLLTRAKKGRRTVLDAEEFCGDTRDEAERAMVDWIDRSGAVETDLQAASGPLPAALARPEPGA